MDSFWRVNLSVPFPNKSRPERGFHCVWRCPLQWCHIGRDGVSNHQTHVCLLNHLYGCRSKKTSKLRVTGLCAGNSPETGEFPAQMASNAESVSIWWRHHAIKRLKMLDHQYHEHKFDMILFFIDNFEYVFRDLMTRFETSKWYLSKSRRTSS